MAARLPLRWGGTPPAFQSASIRDAVPLPESFRGGCSFGAPNRERYPSAIRDLSHVATGAVLDTAGQPLTILRDHRTSLYRADIAIGKASGCLAMGFGGRQLAKRAEAMPAFMTAVSAIFPKGIVPVPGGVLIRDDAGTLLGAVGVSGETSDNDEACALAALAAAGLAADTGA